MYDFKMDMTVNFLQANYFLFPDSLFIIRFSLASICKIKPFAYLYVYIIPKLNQYIKL